MVTFQPKKDRGDTMSLLRPRRAAGLFQRRRGGGGGTPLRSDDDDDDDFDYRPATDKSRSVLGAAGTPPSRRDLSATARGGPPRSDVTPPLSPESDDDDVGGDRDRDPGAYLQFEAPHDPPGHKRTTGGGGGGVSGGGGDTTSLVQNLLCMMDKACVAPAEGEWGSNASAGGPSSDGEEEEEVVDALQAEDPDSGATEWMAAPERGARHTKEAEAPTRVVFAAANVNNSYGNKAHSLEAQKGEKHESFEMILREMTPPRKKKLGIKSLLHLPTLPIRSSAEPSMANAEPRARSRSASPKATPRGGNPQKRKEEQRHRHRDNEGRLHKPLTAVSDLIPVEEEKKEDERYLQPPRSKPRSATTPTSVTKSINPPPITRNLAKEARYKQVLGTWMNSRTPLETIAEDEHKTADAPAQENSATAVRVPGIQNPDMFLAHSDMIGDIVQTRTPDSSPPKAVDKAKASGTGTKAHPVEDVPSEPTAPIKKSRTWMGKWLGGLGLNEEDEGLNLPRSLSRQRSAPGNLTPESSEVDAAKAPALRLWKAAVCRETGRTYYYHRVTRRTTWTKPPDDELITASATSGPNVAEEEDDIKQVLFPTISKDAEEEVLAAKEEIAAILHEMGQESHSVDKILAQYDGREKEFLERLRAASEDQPFDELLGRSGHDGASLLASATVGHSTFAGSSAMSRSLQNRSRQSSHVSGFSSALMSASTQPIRNTGIGRIFATTTNPDIQSHATSISSKQGYMLPPTKADPLLRDEKLSRVPSNIPVPRSRELLVEEFNYNRESKRNKGVIRQTPERHVLVEPSTEYFGDNDDTDTKETDTVSPNDSISALSEADLSFTNNLEAKRHALDEAIANEDWDLAALLSDSLRTTAVQPQPKKREWTQTELDRYISSNDWDAVANYIARVRTGSKSKSKPQAVGAQKRFGAKSQLQHKNLTVRGDSWSASESSFDSDFSSSSSDTYEEIMKARKQKDKFAC